MEKISAALLGVATLVTAVAVGMLGYTLPAVWTMAGDVGGIKATLASIDKRLDGFEKHFDSIDGKLDKIDRTMAMVDLRLVAKETDPVAMVAQSGLKSDAEFGAVKVGAKLYVLPKTEKAAAFLERSGMEREAITPSAFGWFIGTVNDQGRFSGVAAGGPVGNTIR